MECPNCKAPLSPVYLVPPEQQFRYSITLKDGEQMLHAETLGGSISAMRKLLCAVAKQTGQEVEVFVEGIEYGNPIHIDFVILHKQSKAKKSVPPKVPGP